MHTKPRITLSRQPGHVSSVDAFEVRKIAIVFMNKRRCEEGLCSPSLVVNSDHFVPVETEIPYTRTRTASLRGLKPTPCDRPPTTRTAVLCAVTCRKWCLEADVTDPFGRLLPVEAFVVRKLQASSLERRGTTSRCVAVPRPLPSCG